MNPRILVVLAGVAAICAVHAPGQQNSSSDANSTLASSSGGSQPATAPPAVAIGPDQVRPASGPNDTGSPPRAPAASTASPAQPVPNPNPPAQPVPNGKASAAQAGPRSQAAPAAGGSQNSEYVVGPLDVLEIRVWNDPKLSGMYPVRPDGMISIPLIGEIKADGLTVPALSAQVREKLTSVMNDPEVNIQVARINSKRIFVFGGVMKPGEMPLYQNMTVLDALSNVGFKDFANPKKITIMRGNQIFKFNYKEVSKGKHMEQNIYLQNGDRIFVPE